MKLLKRLKKITQTFKDGLDHPNLGQSSAAIAIELFMHDITLQDRTLKIREEFIKRGIQGSPHNPRTKVSTSDLEAIFHSCSDFKLRQKLANAAAFARNAMIKNTTQAYEMILQDLISSRHKSKTSEEIYDLVLKLRKTASDILNYTEGKDFYVYANFIMGLDDIGYKTRMSKHLLTLFKKNRTCAGAYLLWLNRNREKVIEYWKRRGQTKSTDRPFLSMTALIKTLSETSPKLTQYLRHDYTPEQIISMIEGDDVQEEIEKIDKEARVSGIHKNPYFQKKLKQQGIGKQVTKTKAGKPSKSPKVKAPRPVQTKRRKPKATREGKGLRKGKS